MRSFFTLFSCYAAFAKEQRGDVRAAEADEIRGKRRDAAASSEDDIIALSDRIAPLYQRHEPPPTCACICAPLSQYLSRLFLGYVEDCKKKKKQNRQCAHGVPRYSFLPFSCRRWHTSKCCAAEKRSDLTPSIGRLSRRRDEEKKSCRR